MCRWGGWSNPTAMATVARLPIVATDRPHCNPAHNSLGILRIVENGCNFSLSRRSLRFRRTRQSLPLTCFASNGPSPSEISSTAKIRSEVLSPFRSVRMFFYLAFMASGSLGGLIAISQLIGALSVQSRAEQVPEILKGLGIDFGAVSIFAFLYYQENKAKNAQVARLSREETLSNLKIRVKNKVLPLSTFRGIARLVILVGPASYIEESFKRSIPFSEALLERGVLVLPILTDSVSPKLEFEEAEENEDIIARRKKLWQLVPASTADWSKYLSLRMDGRVRGSGVGYPPWNAFVLQLPPVKGMWSGLLDGMDGRVL